MTFQEKAGIWMVETDRGDRFTARFCIMGTGCLSLPRTPEFPGLESFTGPWYHTGNWPKEPVDFSGKRVAVIGTGSSGVQSIPKIAEQAEHLYVFQRTPHYIIPAGNAPLDPERLREIKDRYKEHRAAALNTAGGLVREAVPTKSVLEAPPEERKATMDRLWQRGGTSFLKAYADYYSSLEANAVAADYVRDRIRQVVKDPAVAELLCPASYPIGTKRIVLDTNYYQTYNRANVDLIDVRGDSIEKITADGLKTRNKEYQFDALVFATGYDAMTGALLNIDIRGRNGVPLRETWSAGPRTYLGLMTAGFPNLFIVAGPGSPSVLMNMVLATEQHVDWIADCLIHMRDLGVSTIEAEPAAEDAWVEHVNEVASRTLYNMANSWYLGANVPGKPRVFMPYVGGFHVYRERCTAVAEEGYPGFTLSRAAEPIA
jgi:cyclohexanone monooxygenase